MQGQLGLDYKNPVITIEPLEDGKSLMVYIGFRFYKIIPNDKSSIQYRLLVGQLAFCGFSIARLIEIFGFSRVTIMRYREAIETSNDEAELFERLQGYHCQKTKLTFEVECYIRARFPVIYKDNKTSFNKQLRIELEEKFGIAISREAVRRVITPIREQLDQDEVTAKEIEVENQQSDSGKNEEVNTTDLNTLSDSINEEIADCTSTDSDSVSPADNKQDHYFLHAGVLVLNLWITNLLCGVKKWNRVFFQWMYQIFLGAINFEQARYLVRSELSYFIGKSALSVSGSRLLLSNLSQHHLKACLQQIFEVNVNGLQYRWHDRPYYFYIDGHFDPYYGKLEILKGWNCLLNRTMKGSNHYAIHDSQGYPLFKELKDNFDDFRKFLKDILAKMKSFMTEVPFGIVFDRGGFAEDLFCHYDKSGVYFITWEKFFDINKESDLDFTSKVIIEREFNEVGQYKLFEYKCAETTYRLGAQFRCRKIVLYTEEEDSNGLKSDFYASILTNDPSINHQRLLELMLGRFSHQENDFKYEKKHFGLDAITSYASLPEQSIQAQIDQKKGQLEALKQHQHDLKNKRQQLYDELGIKRLTRKRIERIESDKEVNPRNYENMHNLRSMQPQIQQLQIQIPQEEKKLKRLEKIEAKGYIQLDYRQKLLLDHVKFMARNIFYDAIAEFRKYYTNLRDLHVVFRKLICSAGIVEENSNMITITLLCPYFEGKTLSAVQQFLEILNQQHPIFLDGSNRKLTFQVTSKVCSRS